MLIKSDERITDIKPHFKDGKGEFRLMHILGNDLMQDKCTLFADGTLPPGSTVGMHTHSGTMEICCIREGIGLVRERDTEYAVATGDVSVCFNGECHEVINTGTSDLVYTVLVIKY